MEASPGASSPNRSSSAPSPSLPSPSRAFRAGGGRTVRRRRCVRV